VLSSQEKKKRSLSFALYINGDGPRIYFTSFFAAVMSKMKKSQILVWRSIDDRR